MASNEKGDVRYDGEGGRNEKELSEAVMIEYAVAAGEEETKLGLRQIFKNYYPAAAWSMALSLALVMEGMDVGLVNNFFGQTAYLERFGEFDPVQNKKVISPTWQAGINNGQQAGAICGLLLNGWAQSRFGSRKMYLIAMVLMAATIFVLVFAQNVQMLVIGNVLCGVPWGIFQTLTTAYAAEIAPVAMRGYLTSWVSMCWGSGSFLAAGVLRGSLGLPGDWAWRVPYILQWIWPVPLFIVGWFCPESPWYLVRKERYAEAEQSLHRLAKPGYYTEERMRSLLALMKHTNEQEKKDAASATYWDCFRGVNLRRTEIVCITFLIQILCGQPICSYATQFLRNAGMDQTNAFNYSMAIQSTNIVATGTAILLMGRFGRRQFYLFGTCSIALFQLMIGVVGFVNAPVATTGIVVAVGMILINLCFKLSLGPACYVLVGETPSSRIRSQSVVLARTAYVMGNLINGQIIPRQLNAPSAGGWGWGAKAGLFWMGFCSIGIVYTYFRIPETKDRTFLELDILFQHRISARKFATTQVDLLEGSHEASSTPAAYNAFDEKKESGDERIEESNVATLR